MTIKHVTTNEWEVWETRDHVDEMIGYIRKRVDGRFDVCRVTYRDFGPPFIEEPEMQVIDLLQARVFFLMPR